MTGESGVIRDRSFFIGFVAVMISSLIDLMCSDGILSVMYSLFRYSTLGYVVYFSIKYLIISAIMASMLYLLHKSGWDLFRKSVIILIVPSIVAAVLEAHMNYKVSNALGWFVFITLFVVFYGNIMGLKIMQYLKTILACIVAGIAGLVIVGILLALINLISIKFMGSLEPVLGMNLVTKVILKSIMFGAALLYINKYSKSVPNK